MKDTYLYIAPISIENYFESYSVAHLILGDKENNEENIHILSSLYTQRKARNQGLAKKVLSILCEDADREGATIYLVVAPEEGGINKERLIKLYKSFGFIFSTENDENEMVRSPKEKKK